MTEEDKAEDEEIIGTLENPCCPDWDWITGCKKHGPKHTERLGIRGIFGDDQIKIIKII